MANRSPFISRRWLTNYLLIVLICLFTFIGNKYQVQTGYQPENRINNLKVQDINRVSIKSADGTIELSKQSGSWRIDAPVSWSANNINIERIIDIVNVQTDSRLSSSEIDLSTLGLQFPRAILRLNETDILFGGTNNIGERRYIQTGDTVFLVPDQYLPFMTQGISGLLDRRLLPRSLALQTLDLGDLKLDKATIDNWRPNNAEVSTEQATALVSNWQTLEAAQVRPYQSEVIPKLKIVAGLVDETSIEFYLLRINPEIVLARPDLGQQYHFSEKQYYQLLSVPKDEASTR